MTPHDIDDESEWAEVRRVIEELHRMIPAHINPESSIYGRIAKLVEAQQITPRIINEKRRGSAVIVYHEGYVLSCLRIACRDMNGFWQIPGGAVEFHETIYEAAIREFYEETGGRIEAPDYICDAVAETPEQEPFWTSFFIHVPRARYEAENKEPHRHGPWEWVPIKELLQRKLLPSIGLVLQSNQFKRLITPIPRLNNAQGSD